MLHVHDLKTCLSEHALNLVLRETPEIIGSVVKAVEKRHAQKEQARWMQNAC